MSDDNPKKPGLKLQNNKSMFAGTKKPSQQELDAAVRSAQERSYSYKERAAEIVGNYRKILEDKTLSKNKPLFTLDLEKETIGKIVKLAIDMNHDEQEEEGMGSVGVIALLLSCLVIQRDKINYLDYSVHELQNSIKIIESKLLDIKKDSE